jgi:hypothetical protein
MTKLIIDNVGPDITCFIILIKYFFHAKKIIVRFYFIVIVVKTTLYNIYLLFEFIILKIYI